MKASDLNSLSLPPEVWSLLQRGLAHAGLYQGTYNGLPGEKTRSALDAYLSGKSPSNLATQVIDDMVDWAVQEARNKVREVGGNNRGPRVEFYQDICYQANKELGRTGWPYCAAFCCRAVEAGIRGKAARFTLPTTAAAFGFEQWARNNSGKGVVLLKSGKIKKGDLVIFSISHIGIATADQVGSTVKTVEGNTGSGNDRDGDGVFERTRNVSLFRSWVRITT